MHVPLLLQNPVSHEYGTPNLHLYPIGQHNVDEFEPVGLVVLGGHAVGVDNPVAGQ